MSHLRRRVFRHGLARQAARSTPHGGEMFGRPRGRFAVLGTTVVALLAVNVAAALGGSAAGCAGNAKAGFARVQLFKDANCKGASVIIPKTGDPNRANFAAFRNFDGTNRDVDNSRSSLAIDAGTCVRFFDGVNYTGDASTNICAPSGVVLWNLDRFNERGTSMRVCATSNPAECNAPGSTAPAPAPRPTPHPPATALPPPAAKPPSSSNQSKKVLGWAYRHVSWWAGLYSMPHRLPTNVSVREMQTTEPPRGRGTPSNVKQGCDCSSFIRWAVAQAGIDAGTYTGSLWTGDGKLGPLKPTDTSVKLKTGHAARGWGNLPPGGYHPGDLIFYGVTNMTRGIGHVVLYMGDSKIVQCSGNKRGSNMGRSVTSPGQPTGWVRYDRISG
ncbi:MAG: NlpC/P60 family [Solirubrobacteraceae bacterium]|nr:NlpC/P60 family [Solirubrobacteraceae bacterium]